MVVFLSFQILVDGGDELLAHRVHRPVRDLSARGGGVSAAAVETADKLRNCTVKITAKGGANGKLFGAITGKEISEALMAQFGLDVGKQKIVLDEPIKAFGSYEIRAKLGYEVSGKFTVTVAEE